MLNKNTNLCNIEKKFKYSTVVSTFTEHIIIFWTLSIDIGQLKYQQRKTNKTKNGELFCCKFFRIIKFLFLILLRETNLESKVAPTNRNNSVFLLHTGNFFGNNFRYQNKNNVVATVSCFVYQLSKKYCVYYVTEHLKYCSQINQYCFSVCLIFKILSKNFLLRNRQHVKSYKCTVFKKILPVASSVLWIKCKSISVGVVSPTLTNSLPVDVIYILELKV